MRLVSNPLFLTGRLFTTPAAFEAITPTEMESALNRHILGDWGDLVEEDRQANAKALLTGLSLLSAYSNDRGTTFLIITEADRSATYILLPSDY